MNFKEYQELSARTAQRHENELLNYALGLNGEAGEVADLVKKANFHGHHVTVTEIEKELGDVLWYLAQIASLVDIDLRDVAITNIRKLQKRYPDGFSEEASRNRRN